MHFVHLHQAFDIQGGVFARKGSSGCFVALGKGQLGQAVGVPPWAEKSISALAPRNCLTCSIVHSRVSFMLITILGMINPPFDSVQIYRFRLISGWKYSRRSGSYPILFS